MTIFPDTYTVYLAITLALLLVGSFVVTRRIPKEPKTKKEIVTQVAYVVSSMSLIFATIFVCMTLFTIIAISAIVA